MSAPALDLALVKRPHTEPLPSISTEGFALNVVFGDFQDIRRRFLGGGEWHAAEYPLGRYIALKAEGDETLTAIPVFPWRSFRHGAIHVRNDGSITEPAQLEGRRVGVTDWHQTAGITARGLLVREYGVDLDRIEWVSGGLDGPPRPEVAPVKAPQGFTVAQASAPLTALLAAGEIDAIISGEPVPGHGEGRVTYLIDGHEEVEASWYDATGIFPVMHVIAVRRTALGLLPSLDDLQQAFETAKAGSATSQDEKWRYGFAENRKALDRLLDDAFAQGIGTRRLQPEELFAS